MAAHIELPESRPAALNALQRDFDMFVVSHKPAPANAFHHDMAKYRATYLSQYLPRPYEQHTAILLPRSEPRSAKVAAVLRENGFFDLGEHLGQPVAKQADDGSPSVITELRVVAGPDNLINGLKEI